MIIDVHTHLHPQRLSTAIRKWFMENPGWKLDHLSEPAAVAHTLKENGVARFVFSSYAHRAGMARELNAWLIQTAQSINFYGLPLFTVHLDDPHYVDDAAIALESGCIGLKIHEDVQKLRVDDERFGPVYSLLQEHGGFVLAHIGPIPWKIVPEKGLERVKAVLRKQTDLKFLVAHMGAPDTRSYLPLLPEFPGLYLDTTMAFSKYTADHWALNPDELEAHSSRIVYGSDYPTVPYPYDTELVQFRSMNLTSAALDAILGNNAAQLIAPLARSAE